MTGAAKLPPIPEQQGFSLAMVLLAVPSLPTREQLVAHASARARTIVVDEVRAEMITLTVDGSPVVVGLMPVPIPWSQLEGPCATAWWWRGATETCRSAKAHAIVVVEDEKVDLFERNLRLTETVGLLLKATQDAVGVYWGAGTLVHSPESFLGATGPATREFLPLRLWVDFRVVPQTDGSFFYATTGMNALGLMEIEGTARRIKPDEAVACLFNVAHYLCDHGSVLKDGDTFGLSATERHRVRHRRSAWKRPGRVLWVELD